MGVLFIFEKRPKTSENWWGHNFVKGQKSKEGRSSRFSAVQGGVKQVEDQRNPRK